MRISDWSSDVCSSDLADPGFYGFANVTSAGCGVQPAPAGDSSLFCNPGSYVDPSVQSSYLFADGVHPSAAGQQAIAQLALGMLEGPRQIRSEEHTSELSH